MTLRDELAAPINALPVGIPADEVDLAVDKLLAIVGRFFSLADDLDYYASKSQPDAYAYGLREAALKIRRVIEGADPHDDETTCPDCDRTDPWNELNRCKTCGRDR